LKPVITGTLTTIVSTKAITPNAIVTLRQVVKVAVPVTVTVQSITVNGVAAQVQQSSPAPTPSRSAPAGSTPAPSTNQVVAATSSTVVGPDDTVRVNATTEGGQKIQGVVEIEKVDPFTLANVNFDFASAKLTPAAKRVLDKVAVVVIEHGFNQIQLAGHTDVFASAGYDNQKLSEQRAAAVKAYLAKKLAGEGIAVKTLGLAAKEPVIAKTDEASRALNRRVEILVATK
jgi:OOP family OmpA-OmpF porin